MTFVLCIVIFLSKHCFSIFLFYILSFVLLERITDIENQWLLMDDRFPSGKDFAVTAYHPCVLFQVPLHPFDKENIGLMRCSTFCLFSYSSTHLHINVLSDIQFDCLRSNRCLLDSMPNGVFTDLHLTCFSFSFSPHLPNPPSFKTQTHPYL
jgi:hypothetical protein